VHNRRGGLVLARLLVRAVLALSTVTGLFGLIVGSVFGAGKTVVVLPTTGIVDNVMAGYLSEGIRKAAADGATAVIIRLNTPGGSLTATNDIVGTLLEAPLPVIVWVAPAGGFAASAGTFITLASNVAVMAPGTRIGAASPISSTGEDIPDTLGKKVLNDAIASISQIATDRHRNKDWAVEAVRDARSSPASEAVQLGVVDGIAATLDDVLRFANGRTVDVAGGQVTLDLTGAQTSELGMNPFQAFLHLLSDENIALLLFSAGSLGLTYELINPNFVTGIIGAMAIILAFIGFGSLPLNVAGLLLIILAIVLFILEATVTSHGLLAVGGVVCFFLGASALYTAPGDPFAPAVTAAQPLVIVMTVTFAAFAALIVIAAYRTRRWSPDPGTLGTPLGVGTSGVVRMPLDPRGSIYAAGEEWTARTTDNQPLERGTHVRVIGVDGLTAIVEPDQTASEA
jgi:membrane-bound serine protease (ClpP class)